MAYGSDENTTKHKYMQMLSPELVFISYKRRMESLSSVNVDAVLLGKETTSEVFQRIWI